MSEQPQEDVSEAARALADLQRARDEAAEAERRASLEYALADLIEGIADRVAERNHSRQMDAILCPDESTEQSSKVSSGNGQAPARVQAKGGARRPSFISSALHL